MTNQTNPTDDVEQVLEAVFIPTVGTEEELAQAAYLASLADPTPSGKLIGQIALRRSGPVLIPSSLRLIAPSSEEGMCGIDLGDRMIRKGSITSIEGWLQTARGYFDGRLRKIVSQVLSKGGIAVVIADESSDLGVICLRPSAV